MILVDTSVWVDHLRSRDESLVELLTSGSVLIHPFIRGELACGSMKNRPSIMAYLDELPSVRMAGHAETIQLLEIRELWGRGIGWIDAHLMASALLSDCELWTHDGKLEQAAAEAGVKQHI